MSGPSTPPRDSASVPPSAPRTSTCILFVDDRVVLRATTPPEAEFALFDATEIELRSSEPGRVREHGYQTTAGAARERLEALGATPARARDTAAALQPTLALAYARGPSVRIVAKYLNPDELLATDLYDGVAKAYRGVYLDLATLAGDLDRPHAGVELQVLHLALLLEGLPDAAKLVLTTDAWTKTRRPGERTHRRPTLGKMTELRDAVAALSAKSPQPEIQDVLPRQDVVALLRTRADAAADDDERALYASLQAAITARTRPDRGPLSVPALWSLEQRMDEGRLAGLVEDLEALERDVGRTPGTTYLRGRASLMLRLEPPKLVAERISALALSMTSFQELSLLAAEAWLEAGDARRAMPYARDLVDAAAIDEGLLLRAQRVLARVVGAAPARSRARTLADSVPAPKPPSRASTRPRPPSMPPVSAPDPNAVRSFEPTPSRVPTVRGTPPGGTVLPTLEPPPAPPSSPSEKPRASSTSPGLGAVSAAQPSERPATKQPISAPPPHTPGGSAPPRTATTNPVLGDARTEAVERARERASQPPGSAPPPSSARPPQLDLDLPPPPAASFTLDLPGGAPSRDASSAPPSSAAPHRASRRRMTGVRIETVAPKTSDPRVEPDDDPPQVVVPAMPAPRPPRLDSELFAAAITPVRGTPAPPAPPRAEEVSPDLGRDLLHGASLPAYKIEVPAPELPKAPLLPKTGRDDELAEHLSLPPGVVPDATPVRGHPTSILEARVLMTHWSRELGLDYRLRRGITLRADISGIEAMQAYLLDTYPDHTIRTADDAMDVKRHGALFAEILIRRLDAGWMDITAVELGYWALVVPPDARVWPFGRVARLIANGHRERDLVATFLELQARARSPR